MSNRGDWAWLEMCPKGFYTSGVSFKVEPPQGVMEDDTALNGIWLHCSRSGDPSGGYTAESQSGRLLSNEVATTSAHFACSDGHVLEGPGSAWGQWGGWSPRCPRVVCGIQTQQDPAWGLKRDDTALNDLHLFCP
ncbi:PREDICTED: vitelline membrane outer layer protein 1 homolog [Haliaeetus leucocephalus]|uniref:vitelline membrane outer layer protein 1 homolog n=1 Tax=Haliaeetus leucocephalus TaxID=52644 RepID=UPI00053CB57C|nr:PREDICTED: vitelline membrane outer layer protein 1 homolog [Haliaeetus leucocephalus]